MAMMRAETKARQLIVDRPTKEAEAEGAACPKDEEGEQRDGLLEETKAEAEGWLARRGRQRQM